jgi:hypothetical protein
MKKGIIEINSQVILNWLQLPCHSIIDVSIKPELDIVRLVITGDEMPEVESGKMPPVVALSFIKHQDCEGHWVAIREPLKRIV